MGGTSLGAIADASGAAAAGVFADDAAGAAEVAEPGGPAGADATHAIVGADASLHLDESQVWTERVGRWRRDVLHATKDVVFWVTLQLAHTCRQPLEHVFAWLSKMKVCGEGSNDEVIVCERLDPLAGLWAAFLPPGHDASTRVH